MDVNLVVEVNMVMKGVMDIDLVMKVSMVVNINNHITSYGGVSDIIHPVIDN